MALILNPAHYRNIGTGMPVARHEVESLLDARAIECAMANGRWWTIRRNGATQRWKKDTNRIRIPFKMGLKGYGAITETDFIEG